MEGYDAKFDPPLEKRLECPICLLAQREPMQTPCGHRFCAACILRALRETGQRCPVDNTTVCIHQLFKDNFAKREVLSLNVHCSADHCGCSWQGELRDLQLHSKQCELVLVQCPNSCGHSCQRNLLADHIPNCPNRPIECPTCSIQFPRTSLSDHQPHCSHITLPDSVSATLDKAGEVLKWVGHLKLKLNGQVSQVTGYLTAQSDSEESFLSTDCWCSTISLITLNSVASQIFSRMLQSSEVQPVQLNFALLTSDAKSVAFQKIFKKKPEFCNAAVCLRLRPSNRRETRELTIMYICWCDQRKRLLAYVANLKTHLVRQIQTHLHHMPGSRRHRRLRNTVSSHSNQHHSNSSQPQGRGSIPTPQSTHHSYSHHGHSHPRPHMHIQQSPTQQMMNLQTVPPHNDIQSVIQPPIQHQVVAAAAAAGTSPAILPNLLSWQMSQSFNTYPWRMQATGVPFFTFPSTPPSYIPANSYPYTFAPLPAAPFSISPMQPVPSSVHIPSYNGLSVMVPQVTTVDASAVPINPVVTQGYAVAGPNTAGPSQPVLDRELQAVAVTLGSEGNPVLHVLQPRNAPRPDHQMHQYHQNIPQPPPINIAPTAPPALISTDHPQPSQPSTNPYTYDVIPQPVQNSEHHLPVAGNRHPQRNPHLRPLTSSFTSPLDSTLHDNSVTTHPAHPVVNLDDSQVIWADVPGPSGLSHGSHSQSTESDSSRDSTPEMPSFPSFSSDNDSDNSDASHTPDISVSPGLFDESSSLLSSDQEDSTTDHTDSSTDSSTASALHTLANAAAILADSPATGESSPQVHNTDQPTRLPVLINISDLDSESSPSSIIDLTHSPTTSISHSTSSTRSNPYGYSVISTTAQRAQPPSHPAAHPSAPVRSDSHISAVLVPVLHQWNGTTEQQGLQQMQHYVPSEQVGVVQTAPLGVDEATNIVHHPNNMNSDPLPQPYAVQDYPGRGTAIPNWPAELSAPNHAVQRTLLYPPQQAVSNTPHGDFWDTVIPSLDMTLQHSTTSEN